MSDVLPFPPGRPRVEHAIALVENGDVPAARAVLESMLKARKAPSVGPDERPEVVIRLRAHVEKVVADLVHGDQDSALKALRLGLGARTR